MSSMKRKESEYEYGKRARIKGEKDDDKNKKEGDDGKPKEAPSLALSGNLAKDTNTYNGVVIKYNEPPEARKPIKRWRLYCFKDDTELPFYPMHRQSAYLFGRDRLVADIPVDHPSCSKQHAVFQYRLAEYKRGDGTTGRTVKPYIIDLNATNGTYVNNQRIDPQRYVELREKDVLKFGFSSREYVLLHEQSKGDLPSESESDDEEEKKEETDEKNTKQDKESEEDETNKKEEVKVKVEKN